MASAIDLSGMTFGRLTVLHLVSSKPRRKWLCKCSCGNEAVINGICLRYGHTKSCGCLQKEVRIRNKTTHGMAESAEYRSYLHMMARCYKPNTKEYANYGGRGIDVCEAWRNDFSVFLADMGRRQDVSQSLDRIDNSKGYSPSNCRWASRHQQANNKRSNRLLAYGGQVDTAANWARIVGVNRDCLIARLNLGWDVERALLTPVRGHQL